MKLLEERSITAAEAKEILDEKEKLTAAPATEETAAKELGYEQKVTLEYLRKFVHLTRAAAEKLKAEMSALGTLKEHQMTALIDVMPESEEEINLLFAKERVGLTKEQTAQILTILNSARPREKKLRAIKPRPEVKPEAKEEKAEQISEEKEEVAEASSEAKEDITEEAEEK